MTRPHHHLIAGSGGFASIEHEHPGHDRGHVHEGQPELSRSLSEDAIMRAIRAAAARAGKRLVVPR